MRCYTSRRLLGSHRGLWFHTVGQVRLGLGLGLGVPTPSGRFAPDRVLLTISNLHTTRDFTNPNSNPNPTPNLHVALPLPRVLSAGQRKGVGPGLLAGVVDRGPWYVAAKDASSNTLFITNNLALLEAPRREFFVQDVNWMLGEPLGVAEGEQGLVLDVRLVRLGLG